MARTYDRLFLTTANWEVPLGATLNIKPELDQKAAVISHERSGTHFLMNTLAMNFGYCVDPWWNFDFDQALNFHSFPGLERYFRQVHDKPVSNILKSHHPFPFFQGLIDYLLSQFYVFYIYRNPKDVMVSNWRLINRLDWHEGPRTETVSDFIRSQPSGAMLRYQKQQEPNMLIRWQTHVRSWLEYERKYQPKNLIIVRYEDLNLDFEGVVKEIARRMDIEVHTIQKPSPDQNVVGKGQGRVGGHKELFTDDDEHYVLQEVGDTMSWLNYR